MILNDELNVSLLNDIECVQTFISVFHFSTFKYNKSVDTNIYLQAHGAFPVVHRYPLPLAQILTLPIASLSPLTTLFPLY